MWPWDGCRESAAQERAARPVFTGQHWRGSVWARRCSPCCCRSDAGFCAAGGSLLAPVLLSLSTLQSQLFSQLCCVTLHTHCACWDSTQLINQVPSSPTISPASSSDPSLQHHTKMKDDAP